MVEGAGIRRRAAAYRIALGHQMHDWNIPAIEPIAREVQVRSEANLETENIPIEVARRIEIVGLDSDVMEER